MRPFHVVTLDFFRFFDQENKVFTTDNVTEHKKRRIFIPMGSNNDTRLAMFAIFQSEMDRDDMEQYAELFNKEYLELARNTEEHDDIRAYRHLVKKYDLRIFQSYWPKVCANMSSDLNVPCAPWRAKPNHMEVEHESDMFQTLQ